MNRPILNADVLLLIFSEADVQTQLALISTCQVLYKEGGKRFQPSEYVRPWTERELESFLRFMDADGGSRMRSLHTLDISFRKQEPSESVAKHLSEMLTRLAPVSRLAELCIFPLEKFLSAHPPLSRAIAALNNVEDVRFSDVGERSLELVRSMKAKLVKVTLWGARHDLFKDTGGGGVFTLLQQFSGSLRELWVAGFGDAAHPQDDSPEYPLLSALSLEDMSSPTVSTWHCVRAFPNLKSLKLAPGPDYGREVEHAELLEERTRNMAQLHEHGCWASLDTFEGSIPTLWSLGLPARCPVRCLEVCDKDVEEEDTGMTAEMLRDVSCAARPARLELTICYSDTLRAPATGVADALVEACGATLQEFVLTVKVAPQGRDEEYTNMDDVMEAVTDMLRGFSKLADVSVVVSFEPQVARPQGHDYSMAGWGTSPPASAVDSEDEDPYPETDADGWCDALRDAVPSADFVSFFVFDHRTMGDDWAEYMRDERIRRWE